MALTPPPVAPPAAPPLPGDAPSRANPSTFRALADAFVVWQVGFRDWLAGMVTWLAGYISWASTNVAEMDALQTDVTTKSSAATTAASGAATSAAAVQANRTALDNRLYPGTYPADPVTRPDGSAVQAGDRYFNSSIARQKTYSGTAWATDNLDSAALAASGGSSLIGWLQAGIGAVLRLLQDKLRERWSLEDHGAVGNGVTDARAAIQSVLDALSLAGGGTIYGVNGKTYLVKHKAGVTKTVGAFARAYGLEIPNNVLIDLQGATIKAEAATDYVLVSNPIATPGLNNNSNLGVVNGTIDFNQASAAGSSQAVAFYGVRKLRLQELAILNGYNIGLDLEACEQGEVGKIVFSGCTGPALYVGGATASGGAACDKMKFGTIVCYNTADHPSNPGLPGNPCLINATDSQFGDIAAFTSGSGIKVTAGSDLQFGNILFDGGTTQNSGFKVQGSSETQTIERVTVSQVIAKNCTGPGLLINWARDVEIGSYLGKANALAGLDADALIAGERIKISNFDSIDAGQAAITLTTTNGTQFNRSPECTVDNFRVLNPWAVGSSVTATAVNLTSGTLRVGLLSIVDNRATPKMIRYFGSGTQNKEQSLTADEFYGRGGASNPGFLVAGMLNAWIGRPDISPLLFPASTLTLSSSALGTGVTANATAAPFVATDVGRLLVAQDGRGVAEITAFTDASNVTVANRIAWAGGTAIAANSWYLDRGTGGVGTFTPAAAATSTTVTDAGFANTASRGQPLIEVIPTNAAARTLGKPVFDSFSNATVTFKHAAAAGTETYQYRILGWTN